jgi:hypothetical protein
MGGVNATSIESEYAASEQSSFTQPKTHPQASTLTKKVPTDLRDRTHCGRGSREIIGRAFEASTVALRRAAEIDVDLPWSGATTLRTDGAFAVRLNGSNSKLTKPWRLRWLMEGEYSPRRVHRDDPEPRAYHAPHGRPRPRGAITAT